MLASTVAVKTELKSTTVFWFYRK